MPPEMPRGTRASTPRALQLGDGTTGGRDLLLGRLAERVRRDGQRHPAQLAGAQDLDRLAAPDRAGLGELQRTDLAAVREQLGEPIQVHDLEDDLVAVLEALQLRQAHVDGHLPTLERRRDVLPGLGTLGTPTGGLALRALTATHAGLRCLGAGRRAEVVDLDRHYSTSSTVTRWFTAKIMPRISGRSSLTTTSLIRFRPSDRRESRWFCLRPISDRIWVTFKRAISAPPLPHAPPAWPPAPRPRPAGHGEPRPSPATRGPSARPPSRARC